MSERLSPVVLALSVVLLTACATQQQTNGAANSNATVCEHVYPTGSHIAVKRCKSRRQADAEKDSTAEAIRRSKAMSNGSPKDKFE